jgi:hypothetical protein
MPFVSLGKKLHSRHKDMLNICMASYWKPACAEAQSKGLPIPSIDSMRAGLFCDLSQSVQRKPWSQGVIRCLVQGSVLYSFEHDAVMRPEHHLRLQGMRSNFDISSLSDPEIRALAGEGFCLPCIATCIWALFLEPSADWWPRGRSSSSR